MYYQQHAQRPRRLQHRPRTHTLVELCVRAVIKHNIRSAPGQLPDELVQLIIARRFPPIHPPLRTVYAVDYPHYIVNADAARLTPVAYSPTRHEYMNLLSLPGEHTRARVHVLDPDQDRMLNRVLLDYILRTKLVYADLKLNPYVD